MPRIFDRRTGKPLGRLTQEECVQLMALFEEPTRNEGPVPIDPEVLEQLAESGASEQLLAVVQQIIQDPEEFDVDWEPD